MRHLTVNSPPNSAECEPFDPPPAPAAEAVERSARLTLTGEDAEVFFRALVNPPPFNDFLRRALAEHDQRVISPLCERGRQGWSGQTDLCLKATTAPGRNGPSRDTPSRVKP